jgi:cyclophilin family peptidyl-prolyl cis-trans isomerase
MVFYKEEIMTGKCPFSALLIAVFAAVAVTLIGCHSRQVCKEENKMDTGPKEITNQQQETAATKKTESTSKKVKLETSMGDIVVELDAKAAPVTVDNFLGYVQEGFYNGTIFHRVILNFMIQGGGFTPDMKQKQTRRPIVNEANNGLKNGRGAIAMARTNDPDSATSQFFINHKSNDFLNYSGPDNPGYAVFGKVVEGMDVVDKIAVVKTTEKLSHKDVPVEPVVIKSAAVVK